MSDSFMAFIEQARASQPVPVTDLVGSATEMVRQALQKAAGAEHGYAYGVSLTVVPGEQQGVFVPVLVIALTGPSPIVGDRLFRNLLSFNLHPVQEEVDHLVEQAVEGMLVQRSEITAETTGLAQQPGGMLFGPGEGSTV